MADTKYVIVRSSRMDTNASVVATLYLHDEREVNDAIDTVETLGKYDAFGWKYALYKEKDWREDD